MKIWDSKLLKSKVDSQEVGKLEMFMGYLLGPALMYLMTSALSGTYLMQFYTDVIGISGSLIIIMPIVSKIAVVVMNIVFSSLINKTNTSQGKARPWLLVSGILLPISGILLYAIPNTTYQAQIIWILFSYNFFFVIAYNIYVLSHSMLLPRSTKNSKVRDRLSLFKNVSEAMIPGTLSAVIMPFIIRAIGVGNAAQNGWFKFMLILSIIAIPAAAIEYYFTIERIDDKKENPSLIKQIKQSFKYKKWIIVVILVFLKALEGAFTSNAMIYYSNWVMGNSIESGAKYQALLNVIGQGPLGIGVFMLWPLLKKYDKYDIIKYFSLVGIVGSLIMFLNPNNIVLILIGMMLKSIGNIPLMMSISLMSDVMDEIEEKDHVRFDSLGASINSIVHNISVGLAQTLILLSINIFGYIVPQSSIDVISQPESLRTFFNICMAFIPLIQFIFTFILVRQIKNNKKEDLVK